MYKGFPTGTVEPERIFSGTKDIVTPKRSHLLPENVEILAIAARFMKTQSFSWDTFFDFMKKNEHMEYHDGNSIPNK